jgi:hypothetical protein
MKYKQQIILIILVIILTAVQFYLFAGTRSIEDYTSAFLLSSLVYLVLVYTIIKAELKKNLLFIILLCLFIPKLFFIPFQPIGSDDYYRYLWDGKVLSNGINPYLYAPADPKLESLHSDLLPEKVSYPKIKTIYFPLSQWLFTTNFLITGENTVGLKSFYLLFDLIIILSLYFLLKKFFINPKYLLIYIALPLVNFQFFIDAHIDIVGVAFMTASLAFYFYDKKLLSYILLGLSLSVKPTGLILIPFLFQNETNIKEKIQSIIIPFIVFFITFLPYIFIATPLDTLINYTIKWTFNGMVYNSLNLFLSDNITIRIICGTLYILFLGIIYLSKFDLIRKIYLSMFILMLFSPVVHPWYLIWFAVLLPIIISYSGIYFASTISLTFITVITYQNTGIWKEYSAVLLLQYIPIAIIFYYEVKRKIFSNKLRPNN